MKSTLLTSVLLGCSIATLPAVTSVVNYWDFESDYTDKVGPSHGTAGVDVSAITGHDGNTGAFFPTSVAGGGAFSSAGYVDIAPQISNIGGGTTAFSMSYWVRLDADATTNARGIFDFSGDGATNDGPQSLYIQSGTQTGNLAFRVDGTGDAVVGFVPVSAFEGTGTWIFLAANFDPAGNMDVYLNGNATPAASVLATGVGTVNWNADQYLGAFNVSTTTNRGLEGGLDDVAIYDGLLTTGQIGDLFSGALAPTQIPEPSASLLGLLGAAALLRRRR